MVRHDGMSARQALREVREHARYENFYAFLGETRGQGSVGKTLAGGAVVLLLIGGAIALTRGKEDDSSGQSVPGQTGPSVTINQPVTESPTASVTATPEPRMPEEDIVEQPAGDANHRGTIEAIISSGAYPEEMLGDDTSYSPPGDQGIGDTVDFAEYGVTGTIISGGFRDGKYTAVSIDMNGDGESDFYYGRIFDAEYAQKLAAKYDLSTTDIAMIEMDTDRDGKLDEVMIELDGVDTGYRLKYGLDIEGSLAVIRNPKDNAFYILENPN